MQVLCCGFTAMLIFLCAFSPHLQEIRGSVCAQAPQTAVRLDVFDVPAFTWHPCRGDTNLDCLCLLQVYEGLKPSDKFEKPLDYR